MCVCVYISVCDLVFVEDKTFWIEPNEILSTILRNKVIKYIWDFSILLAMAMAMLV